MRRFDREVTNINDIYKIIDACTCCRLGFCDEGEVYIVPMNFGYSVLENKFTFYFHSAKEGRKISLIQENPNVGFEMDCDYKLNPNASACAHSARFKSIIGNGKVSFVTDNEEKNFGLQKIMSKNTNRSDWDFDEKTVNSVLVFKLVVNNMSCKEHE